MTADGQRAWCNRHRVADARRYERALHERRRRGRIVGRIVLVLATGDDGGVHDRPWTVRPHDDQDGHELVVGDRADRAADRVRAGAGALRRRDRYERDA